MQTIETVKDWSTPEAAELLGSNDARIRQLKSNHGNQLSEGVDFTKGEQSKTRWTQAGIKKLAGWLQTESAIAANLMPIVNIWFVLFIQMVLMAIAVQIFY